MDPPGQPYFLAFSVLELFDSLTCHGRQSTWSYFNAIKLILLIYRSPVTSGIPLAVERIGGAVVTKVFGCRVCRRRTFRVWQPFEIGTLYIIRTTIQIITLRRTTKIAINIQGNTILNYKTATVVVICGDLSWILFWHSDLAPREPVKENENHKT